MFLANIIAILSPWYALRTAEHMHEIPTRKGRVQVKRMTSDVMKGSFSAVYKFTLKVRPIDATSLKLPHYLAR